MHVIAVISRNSFKPSGCSINHSKKISEFSRSMQGAYNVYVNVTKTFIWGLLKYQAVRVHVSEFLMIYTINIVCLLVNI